MRPINYNSHGADNQFIIVRTENRQEIANQMAGRH